MRTGADDHIVCSQLTLEPSWPYRRLLYHCFHFDFSPITLKNSLAVAFEVDGSSGVLIESWSFNIER
jgi:hypothetical protein